MTELHKKKWIRDSYKAAMRKIIFNEFEEDIANEFERKVQLCATGAKKAQKSCQFYSSLFCAGGHLVYEL